MMRGITQRIPYLLAELLGAAVYGVILYFVFTWLAEYSLLYAYFGNLALMILFIALEELSIRSIESEDALKKVAERGDREKVYSSLQAAVTYNISAKTILYLFYIFVLIFSQIVESNPALLSEHLSNFILSNNYSILLLIALDGLIGQVSKERERMKKLSAKLKESFAEKQD